VLATLLAVVFAVVPGERLLYDVRYGPLTVGTLTLEALEPDTVDSVECRHLRADLELTRSISWLFSASYRLESWCRTSDFVTLRSYKRTREPRYKSAWTARYVPSIGQVFYSDGRCYALPDSARDMLTLWYYFRNRALAAGETLRAAVHDSRRNYELVAGAGGVRRVSVPAGEFDCVAVNPKAGTPLGSVYLSDDDERLPVVIRTRFGGFVISALLRSFEMRED
jgi:hypothetical protein